MATLFAIYYSPWSLKARWALDHQKVRYRYVEYVPMLGEPVLRAATRKFTGKVTVPTLLDGTRVLRDSWDIAQWADARGQASSLLPADKLSAIAGWNEQSELLMSAGRVLATQRTLSDVEAMREALPGMIPNPLRAPLTPLAALGTRFIASKYGAMEHSASERREFMRGVLSRLDNAIATSDFLLGSFSYADIAMAMALQFVKPVEGPWVRLGPATVRCWTDEALVAEFPKVLTWRDRLFAAHR